MYVCIWYICSIVNVRTYVNMHFNHNITLLKSETRYNLMPKLLLYFSVLLYILYIIGLVVILPTFVKGMADFVQIFGGAILEESNVNL